MNKNDCPCYQCICIPMCRHKIFEKLTKECQPLDYYYHNESYYEITEKFQRAFENIKKCLKPTKWGQ